MRRIAICAILSLAVLFLTSCTSSRTQERHRTEAGEMSLDEDGK